MDRLRQDVRFALRGFRRTPVLAGAIILILAIGIGMAAAAVTVYDAVLLRKLPVVLQDGIVLPRVIDRVGVAVDLMPPQIATLNREAHTMHGVAGVTHGGANAAPLFDGTRTVIVRWTGVTGNFFDVLNTRPVIGRFFNERDDVVGAPLTLVLSYHAWHRDFSGDSSVIGRHVVSPYYAGQLTIVGVAPPGLDYPAGVEAWIPSTPLGGGMMNIVARLAPSATPASAGDELYEFMKRDAIMGGYMASAAATAATLPTAIVGDVRPALTMLTAAVALLLLIVCVNVGNLLLSRAAGRSRELGVRTALGATTRDIVRQLFVESALLGLAGSVLGVLCAEGLLRTIMAIAPASLPRLDTIQLGGPTLAWCGLTSLAALVVFGVAPAVLGARRNLATPLRSDARSGQDRGHGRLRDALVASQVALALLVLVGGSLVVRSLMRLQAIQIGYSPEGLSFLTVSLSYDKFGGSQKNVDALYDDLDRELHAVPGVTSVTPVLVGPYTAPDLFLMKVTAETGATAGDDDHPLLPVSVGGPELFRTLGTKLIRGREFLPSEVVDGAPKVAVVSKTTANLMWPNADPIGKRFRATFDTGANRWITVVGVADDIRYRRLKQAQPMVYVPWREFTWGGAVAIRTTRPVGAMQHELEHAVHAAHVDVALWSVRPAEEYLDGVLAQPRMNAGLLAVLGLVAALLAAIGLYAIMSGSVRERTREIGVRMALGATQERVRRELLHSALRVTGLGIIIGLALAVAGGRVLMSILFEVSPEDPSSYCIASVVLAATAAVAAYLPARRATRIDPATALRAE